MAGTAISLHVELSSHPYRRAEAYGGYSTWYETFEVTIDDEGGLTYWDNEAEQDRLVELVDADMAELRALIEQERAAHPELTYLGSWGYPTKPGAERRLIRMR